MHWIRSGRDSARKTAIAPAARSRDALALQRAAGNRATHALLQRAVLTDEKLPMVRFTVGVEIGSSLAALAWSRTTSGALDDAAISELRTHACGRGQVAELEPLALEAIRRLYRLRRGAGGQWDGLSGDGVLDWRFR